MNRSAFATCFAAVVVAVLTLSASAGTFDAWSHRLKLKMSGYDKQETLSNFPILVVLRTNTAGFSYNQFASTNGFDLRFFDATRTTELAYEIEQWDTNGSSFVWVKLPTLVANTAVWAYWGNTNETSRQAYTTNGIVWSATHDHVNHFSEIYYRYSDAPHWKNSVQTDPSVGGFGLIKNNHSTTAGSGITGMGVDFNGSDETASCYDFSEFSRNNDFSITLWAKPSGAIDNSTVGSGGAGSGERQAWGFNEWNGDSKAQAAVSVGTNGISLWEYSGNGGYDVCKFMAQRPDTNWVQITVVYTNRVPTLYVNGVSQGQGTQSPREIHVTAKVGAPSGCYYGGSLDEMRLGVPVSSNWVWAAWLNQASNSAFCTAGTAFANRKGPVIELR